MIRADYIMLAIFLAWFAALVWYSPAYPAETTMPIEVTVVQCGDNLDEAINSCQDGIAVCCQLVESAGK